MAAYTNWTASQAKDIIRREVMDTGSRWWQDAEIYQYLNDWQNTLQQEYEFVWGTCTLTTTESTIEFTEISPSPLRIDAIYYGTGSSAGFRLSGRTIEDLEVGDPQWRNTTGDAPRAVVQYDTRQITIWPPPEADAKFVFEYPTELAITTGTDTIAIPWWTQWSAKPYVCAKLYLRPGPVNDLQKSLRYTAMFERQRSAIKKFWDNYFPERYRRLKPAGPYEKDILVPPPAWET